MASPGMAELWRRGVALAPCSRIDCAAGLHISAGVGLAFPREGGNDCGVNSQLRTMPQRQAVGLDATGTSRFMSANRTLRATRAPASRQTRATT